MNPAMPALFSGPVADGADGGPLGVRRPPSCPGPISARSRAEGFSERFARIPSALIQKVNGVASEEGFVYIGGRIADTIGGALGGFAGTRDVLDFGCGLGRVAARLFDRAPDARIVGFDIDPMMLKWGEDLLAGQPVRFVDTTLDLPNRSFDLVIAVSVFTHLDATTDYWLAEIHRLLRPGGRAFLTYHDQTLFGEMALQGQLPGVASDGALADRYVLGRGTPEGGAAMGTFYTTEHWERLLDRWFVISATAERGMFGHQSYSVVRPKPVSPPRGELLRHYARSLERQLSDLRREHQVFY